MAAKKTEHKAERAPKKRTLATNVAVRGTWYGPDYGNADQVPDDVAEHISDDNWE